MDKSKAKLDRVRPILQAMERSIDAARRRRTMEDVPETPPAAPARPPDPIEAPRPIGSGPVDPETATRMRARPKRPRGFDDVRPTRPA